ncbi:hypothetical protein TL16_g02939 [Triparma laevis f. inornata]|uniref:Uncharacterized protein n=2 Tax=Triparma laevis TaxID=1534972 RepID=A0A9W7E319_9STRA|nr:hypothetical protein TL16_g02939 [Triparma laevis f. inornata]GMH60403.1 hypothetical protein TrLO_g3817 [Triparma laevis f. longispina]
MPEIKPVSSPIQIDEAGLNKLQENFSKMSSASFPTPNFPPISTIHGLADVKLYLSSLDESTSGYLWAGISILTVLFLKAGGGGDGDAQTTRVASAPSASTATISPPSSTPTAPTPVESSPPKDWVSSEKASTSSTPSQPKKLVTGKPGDPATTLADSKMKLMALEQEMKNKEMQRIVAENAMLKEKGYQPTKKIEKAAPPTAKPEVAAQEIAAPVVAPPNPAPPTPTPAPAPPAPALATPKPVASTPKTDPLAAAKAAAKTVKSKPTPKSNDDWSTLSAAAVKRKTVAELKEFIVGNGGKVASKAKKAEVVEEALRLLGK